MRSFEEERYRYVITRANIIFYLSMRENLKPSIDANINIKLHTIKLTDNLSHTKGFFGEVVSALFNNETDLVAIMLLLHHFIAYTYGLYLQHRKHAHLFNETDNVVFLFIKID